MLAEEDGNIDDAEAADKQHSGCDRLDGEFDVGADGAEIVIDSEKKNKGSGHQNRCQGLRGKRGMQLRNVIAQCHGSGHA